MIPTQWGKKTRREEPLGILKRRFARGEISKEEFEEQKKVLESNE
jgi:putative membrane protein